MWNMIFDNNLATLTREGISTMGYAYDQGIVIKAKTRKKLEKKAHKH